MQQPPVVGARADVAGARCQSYGGWNWRDDFTNDDEEVEYLRQWIIDRWAVIDAIY